MPDRALRPDRLRARWYRVAVRNVTKRLGERVGGGAVQGLAAAGLVLALGCSPAPPERPRNLLLVTLDTTRADRLGCYGHAAAETPTLDALAREGVLFERAFSVAPITLPSHATILTGLQPFRHGVRNNGTHALPEDVPTLAEALRARGFATGAVVSAIVLDSRHGLDRGFDEYDDDLSQALRVTSLMYRETRAEDSVRRALEWLDERGDEPWMLWLHLFDPHALYEAPEPYASRLADPYDAEIAYTDAQLGRLLDALSAAGELDETLVAVTADHGEALGEHGEESHGLFVYDATTRVPLILRHPSLPAGRRVASVASVVDLVPTVLELFDLPSAGALDGVSLVAAMRGADGADARFAYSEAMYPLYSNGWADLRSMRSLDARYVRAPRPEWYSVPSGESIRGDSPFESRDRLALGASGGASSTEIAAAEASGGGPLATASDRPAALDPTQAGRLERHRAALEALLPDVERDARAGEAGELDEGLAEALAELGYVWNEREAPSEEAQRLDPKDGLASLARTRAALRLAEQGEVDAAIDALRAIAMDEPRAMGVRGDLALLLERSGRAAEALEVLHQMIALPGVDASQVLAAARLARALGRDEWRTHVELARRIDPRDPRSYVWEGLWLAEDGDREAGRERLARALELDERCAEAWIVRGHFDCEAGDMRAAEEAWARALELDPLSADARRPLVERLLATGRAPRAIEVLESAVGRMPGDVESWTRLAALYSGAGRRVDEARAYEGIVAARPERLDARLALANARLRAAAAGAPFPADAPRAPETSARLDALRANGEARANAPDGSSRARGANGSPGVDGAEDAADSRAARWGAAALEALLPATREHPAEPEVWRLAMLAARLAGDHSSCLEAATRLGRLEAGHLGAAVHRALALDALGRDAEARDAAARCLELDEARTRARAAREPALRALLDP